jgi:hypothetical protein
MKKEFKNFILNIICQESKKLKIITDKFGFLTKNEVYEVIDYLKGQPIIRDNSGYRIVLNKKSYYKIL